METCGEGRLDLEIQGLKKPLRGLVVVELEKGINWMRENGEQIMYLVPFIC
jgi:hypothetical protein